MSSGKWSDIAIKTMLFLPFAAGVKSTPQICSGFLFRFVIVSSKMYKQNAIVPGYRSQYFFTQHLLLTWHVVLRTAIIWRGWGTAWDVNMSLKKAVISLRVLCSMFNFAHF